MNVKKKLIIYLRIFYLVDILHIIININMKRRDFLNKLALGTATSAGIVTIVAGINEILPPETESFNRVKIGQVDDFPLNEFSFIPDKKIYVYRTRQSIRILSAVCTHLGCTIKKSEKGFLCPCHGSHFNKEGIALSGPASRSLDRLKLDVNKNGLIIVNLKQTVDSDYIL
jgi:cytochrome b6-f complex iron-sulfur subunit